MAKLITLENISRFKGKIPAFLEAESFVKTTTEALVNYYKKSETYTQSEVQALIETVKQFTYEVVTTLPTASASTMHKIYLVSQSGGKTGDAYDEFITLDKGASAETRYVWEKIGDTRIDLSNYYTKEEADAAIATAIAPFKTEAQIKTIVEAYGYLTEDDAEATYVKQESGKGLSTNDYTTAEKNKLAGIAEGAEVNLVNDVTFDGTSVLDSKTAKLVSATNAEIDALFS